MKKGILKVSLSMFSIFFLYNSIVVSACTIFTKHDGSLVLVGNNEDWMYSYPSLYWIVKSENDKYSRICFGNSTYVQGGMNEKGLFYDGASCPYTEVPYVANKESLGMDAGEAALSQCATVQEAIEFFQRYNPPASGDHLLLADPSGDAAVIEWVKNEIKVTRADDNILVATNFFLTAPELGGYPCGRYDMAETILNKPQPLSILEFSSICRSTTQYWGDGGTKYSNVYDLKELTVYIYNKADFSNAAVIVLKDELEKLRPGDRSIDDIQSLTYLETASLLGGEVVDYRVTANNDIDVNGDSTVIYNNKTNEEMTLSTNEHDSISQGNNSLYLMIIAVIILLLIVLFVSFLYFHHKNHKHK